MDRRTLLRYLCGGALALPYAALTGRPAQARIDQASLEKMQENWRDLLPESAEIATSIDPLERTSSEWRASLDEAAYHVLFEEGTERPFTSPLNDEERRGVYVCAACSLPLFTSEMKYDSGTGWPSFFTHVPGHLDTKTDFKLVWPRTEYHCIKCGGHQGHVFDDGPAPTSERWCNNGVSLRFVVSESA